MGLNGGESLAEGLITGFGHHVLIDVAVGIAAGIVWSRVWPLVAGQQFGNSLNLGTVLGVFAIGRQFGGRGLLAELVLGPTLADMPRTARMARQGERMLAFHSELTFLVRSFFFVLLGIHGQVVSRAYVLPILEGFRSRWWWHDGWRCGPPVGQYAMASLHTPICLSSCCLGA